MTNSTDNTNFDAIVIGSGISGGWAAKELTEKGLKTLVIERGRDVQHITDYPTTNLAPWQFEHRNELTEEIREANPIISRCYAFREDAMHFFVKDKETSLRTRKTFRLGKGLPIGWQIAHLGKANPTLERLRFRGAKTRWLCGRLAHPL